MRIRVLCLIALLLTALLACSSPAAQTPAPSPAAEEAEAPPTAAENTPIPAQPSEAAAMTRWDLWSEGTTLRGANIYQRRNYPELEGDYNGPGPVGPPYTQEDFNRLASLGANYVNISHPGLFTEKPPFALDPAIQQNLDQLLEMIARADMFAVISFRTGPGRSEFTFFGPPGDWFDASYLNDTVWEDPAAQDAWAEMWRTTAERYRNHPIVVGYDLMVEPNSNGVFFDLWEPDEFYADYGGTTYDWNQFYPRIVEAIREVDTQMPILIGAMSFSNARWLPYLAPVDDPRVVYTAHQYAPHDYTHQEAGALTFTYPGEMDLDWDGEADAFDRAWLEGLLEATVVAFRDEHGVPVAINEFGVQRYEPGAAEFMDDEMGLFEALGLNYALWVWDATGCPAMFEKPQDFNLLWGPDPDSRAEVSNDLLDVVVSYWERNTLRPSNTTFMP